MQQRGDRETLFIEDSLEWDFNDKHKTDNSFNYTLCFVI